ncbi:uncharacterized protein YALI1_D20496g [Yarrowia lipolytica]|uniref:Uncharacterized protein n=1 Tax=Yarrowia lipolytica TaxID=4952 RepID=A0A1D8NEU7_YARLL|nr:hypothetical protein YALI1_D20496g [Yarrowia lipolytica]
MIEHVASDLPEPVLWRKCYSASSSLQVVNHRLQFSRVSNRESPAICRHSNRQMTNPRSPCRNYVPSVRI